MKFRNLVSKRYKEVPADCQIVSQALMTRGGYIKSVGNGIFSLFPPTVRVVRKIEEIIREEMNRIDGQEVLFPVAMPAALWQESGRYTSVGSELVRFTDRSGGQMVLGMTHEEAAVHLTRDVMDSYTQFPFMIYQIQTKFRDEPRARGGLIRVREFTMKDGYSYHTTQEDLEKYYLRCHEVYERIFARAGLPEVISVASDSGMMGGKVAHEFMFVTEIGEDTLVLCDACDYRANMEAAPLIVENQTDEIQPLAKVATPDVKTIEALCAFLGIEAAQTCKAVVYRINETDQRVVVFLRGDLEVNETKLRNHLKAEIHPDVSEEGDSAITYGFLGPIGLDKSCVVVYDQSLVGIESLVTGANEPDAHLTGFNIARDVGKVAYVDVAKTYEGAICPKCGAYTISIQRGIEVGNIFQLGDKYSKAMGMQYADSDGELKTPVMGCYGIGVGRLAASVCEARHDDNGPIWPMPIAPWQVEICSLRADQEEVAEVSQSLYGALGASGIESLWDDRAVSAGVMFADADLMGVPIRAVVSPKGLKDGTIELAMRDKSKLVKVPVDEAVSMIREWITEEMARYAVD